MKIWFQEKKMSTEIKFLVLFQSGNKIKLQPDLDRKIDFKALLADELPELEMTDSEISYLNNLMSAVSEYYYIEDGLIRDFNPSFRVRKYLYHLLLKVLHSDIDLAKEDI